MAHVDLMAEIEKLYSDCGLVMLSDQTISNEINMGTLENKLNTNFSNLYQKNEASSFDNITTIK